MIVSNSNTISKNKISVPVGERNLCCLSVFIWIHQNRNIYVFFRAGKVVRWQRWTTHAFLLFCCYFERNIYYYTMWVCVCKYACRFISFKKSNKHLNETMLLEFRVHQRLASAGSHFLCVHASLCNVLYICILAWFCLFFGNRGFFFQIYVRNPLTLKQSDK